MSRTKHHGRVKRHAPAWFKRMLNRLYRRKADRELRKHDEVHTQKPKGADWEWW